EPFCIYSCLVLIYFFSIILLHKTLFSIHNWLSDNRRIMINMVSVFFSQFFVLLSGRFKDGLHLCLCDHGEGSGIQQEEYKEESNGSDKDPNIYKCRREHCPGGWKIITVKRGNDDHETLKPHPDVHHDRDKEGEHDAGTQFLEPHELWREYVTGHHRPVGPPVRSCSPVKECILFVFYS